MSSTVPIRSFTDNPHLRRSKRFSKAATRVVELKDEIAERQEEYDEIRNETLLPEMIEAGEKRVDFNGSQIGVVERTAGKKLNKQKLIAELEKRGIDLSIIDDASDPTEASTYVEVRSPKDAKREVGKKTVKVFRKGMSGAR
jgi:hypothetical protein